MTNCGAFKGSETARWVRGVPPVASRARGVLYGFLFDTVGLGRVVPRAEQLNVLGQQ